MFVEHVVNKTHSFKVIPLLQWEKDIHNEMTVKFSESQCGVKPKIKVQYYGLPW